MTSVSGAALDGTTRRSHRLSVLPAALGTGAVVVLLVSAAAAGLTSHPEWGAIVSVLAAAGVAGSVIIGHPVPMYTGLTVLIISYLALPDALSFRAAAIAGAGMFIAHELVRVSTDIRRPARFGPKVWRRHITTTVGLAGLIVAIAWLASESAPWSLPSWLIPVGISAGAIPLVSRWLVAGGRVRLGPSGTGGRRTLAVVAGVMLAATATVAATLAASARDDIASPVTSEDVVVADPTPATEVGAGEASLTERRIGTLILVVALIIAGLFYAAFKRPSADYDLDESEQPDEDESLTLGGGGHADVDDEQVEIDHDEFVRLLDELAIDLGAEADPGRAIRYAYANVERRLAAIMLVRGESETEPEFLDRTLPSLGHRGQAMVELTTLFERARFGYADMTETMRERAIAAVHSLRDATSTASGPDNTAGGSDGAGFGP